MTSEAFLNAVNALAGLPEELMEELMALDAHLSDEDRAELIKELKQVSSDIESEAEIMQTLQNEITELIEEYKHDVIPKMRKEVEVIDRAQDEQVASALFDSDIM